MKKLNTNRQRIRVRRESGSGKLRIDITPNETNDPIKLSFTLITKDGIKVPVMGKYYIVEGSGKQPDDVNIINDYHASYAKEEARRAKQARNAESNSMLTN